MASSTSDTFAFPCPPAASDQKLDRAHARQPTQASSQTSDTCRRAAASQRTAAPFPLPIFTFPCQMASTSETRDETLPPSKFSRHHRRNNAISVPTYYHPFPGHISLPALPKHLVSRSTQASHHPYPQKRSSALQFQVGNKQLEGHDDDAVEHLPLLTMAHSARLTVPHTYEASALLFSPENLPDTMDSTPTLHAVDSHPPCPRSISTFSAATTSTTASSCPTLVADYSPLPTPDAHIESHNLMDVDAITPTADAADEDVPQDFEAFKTFLAAKLDINTAMDDEDDDDEFWQCRGFAATQCKESARVIEWMRDCDEGTTTSRWDGWTAR